MLSKRNYSQADKDIVTSVEYQNSEDGTEVCSISKVVEEKSDHYAENKTVYFLSPNIGLSDNPAKTVGCPLYGSCVVNEGDSSTSSVHCRSLKDKTGGGFSPILPLFSRGASLSLRSEAC